VKGQGAYYQVECVPDKVNLGPVLPYKSVEAAIELRNPMDQAIEVYSLDFDRQYIVEEEVLKRHDNFANMVAGGPMPEPLYLPLRQPGSEFWPHLKMQDEKKRQLEALKKELADVEEQIGAHDMLEGKPQTGEDGSERPAEEVQQEWEEKKTALFTQKSEQEAKIADAENEALPIKYPSAVKEHERLNLILIGPEKSGRTTVANYLA
jgi:hypothetical protein